MTPEELLKEVGEPVAWLESDLIHAYTSRQTGFFPNYRDKKGHGLFTSDQVAAAIAKAEQRVAEACALQVATETKFPWFDADRVAKEIRSGEYRKFMKGE